MIDYAVDFCVCQEVAQDAIACLKPVWMYATANRGPSKVTFAICCHKILRASKEKVDSLSSEGALALRRETAHKISE